MSQDQLIKDCEALAKAWVSSPLYDKETQDAVRAMLENEDKT